MPRTRVVSSRRSGRSNKDWSGIISATATTVPAASKVLIANFTLNNPGIDETVLRTVGVLTVSSDQESASELQLGAFGMSIVTTTALAVGVTAIPGPVTDVGNDSWFTFVPIQQHLTFVSATGVYPRMGVQYFFDSRAKRIVESGSAIAIMVENAHATHGFKVTMALRMLSMVRGT